MRLVLCIFLSLFSLGFAKEVPSRPYNSYVYDENRMLSQAETMLFNEIAEELYRKTGVGLAAALFQNVGDEEPRDFALKVASTWKIGNKNDEGVLIFVTLDEKRRSVETGYGAEIILPDALIERIQQKTLVPAFRQNKYGEGIIKLALGISEEVAKAKNVTLNYSFSKNKQLESSENKLSPLGFFFFLILAVFLVATPTGRTILIYLLLSSLSGGGSSRGNSRGGFGGGFGGGRFGGGGSGGSW